MMKEFLELLKQLIEKWSVSPPVEAVVIEVDELARTCTVKPEDAPELYDVRLKAVEDLSATEIVLIPSVGSTVIIQQLDRNENDAYITKYSLIDKVILKGDVVINDGTEGSVLAQSLKKELDKNNALLNAMLQVINGAPIPEAGNSAPSSFQASLAGAIKGKEIGDFSKIENKRVKHG